MSKSGERIDYITIVDKDDKVKGMIENRLIDRHISQKMLEYKHKAEELDQ
ncbi:MAG: hypothetical protein ACLFSQ_04100 [Candidatus Zixiibacteriota bacterium]